MKKYQASALIVSLLVLAAILIISLSVSLVSLKERKISSGSAKSSRAFQIANSGAEKTLNEIKDGWTTVKDFEDHGISCSGGVIAGNASSGSYKLTFKDSAGTSISCGDNSSIIASIKSVGKYEETHRAIEVAVASGGSSFTCSGTCGSNSGSSAAWTACEAGNSIYPHCGCICTPAGWSAPLAPCGSYY